jgi:hypothetical protein
MLLTVFFLSAMLIASGTGATQRLGVPAVVNGPQRAEAVASGALSAVPANHDFDTEPTIVGDEPLNYDFSDGGANWTVNGSATFPGYASITSGYITSSAYDLDPEVEVITLLWRAPNFGYNSAGLQIRRASDNTLLKSVSLISCSNCSQPEWIEKSVGLADLAGETVKIRVSRSLGKIEADDVSVQHDELREWHVYSGGSPLQSDASHGNYAVSSSRFWSDPFTLFGSTLELDYAFPGNS